MFHRIFFIFRALRFIVKLWVYPKVRFVDREEIAAAGKKKCSVCYIIRSRSLLDALILDWVTRKFRLPVVNAWPNGLKQPRQVSIGYLIRLGFFSQSRTINPPSSIQGMAEDLKSNPELEDIWMVPVTTIWGLGPDSKEVSWFRLLFADDQRAGIFQKLLISIVNGRSTYVEIGKKVSLREQLRQTNDPQELAKKMRRIFRVHFQKVRTQVIGPETASRERVVRSVIRTPAVQSAIKEESRASGKDLHKVKSTAKKYLYQISADQQFSTVRFCEMILDWAFRKLFHKYEVYNAERVREISKTHEIIYLPCHKSHLDYLMLAFLTHKNDLPPPYIGAGENLNFFPIGGILRRGGAFFLRRKFKGDKLYSTAFNAYLRYLLEHKFHVAFFPEGGRTRTGRLMQPKTGMLSMVLKNSELGQSPKVAFIPLYIGYDRVPEIRSYLKELAGESKRKENFFEFLKVWKIFEKDYGNAYFNFGEPILLNTCKTNDFVNFTNDLGSKVMQRIAESAVLSAVGLLSFILLADMGDKEECELISALEDTKLVVEKTWANTAVINQSMTAKEIIGHGRSMGILKKFSINQKSYYRGSEDYHLILRFYRNEAIHLLLIPSLAAQYLTSASQPTLVDLQRYVCSWVQLFGSDFHLNCNPEHTKKILSNLLTGLHEVGALHYDDERIQIATSKSHKQTLFSLSKFTLNAQRFYAEVLRSVSLTSKFNHLEFEAKINNIKTAAEEEYVSEEESTYLKFFNTKKTLTQWQKAGFLDDSERLTPRGKQAISAAGMFV